MKSSITSMERRKLISVSGQAALLLAMAGMVWAQPASAPQIEFSVASTNLNPGQLTIKGLHFGTAIPAVTLDGIAVTALSYTDTMIVVEIPLSFVPGSYTLVVSTAKNQSAASVATIGTTGPPGPTGPAGPAGLQGVQGLPGAQGLTGAAGTQGSPGLPGLTWRGAWNSSPSVVYAVNDAVSFNGSSYVAILGGGGVQPDINPQGWSLLASVGSTGSTGAAGAPGQQGQTGQQGPQGVQGTQGIAGAQGPTGPAGATGATGAAGLVWRGVWNPDPDFHYAAGDAVSFNGSSYIALTANNGAQPNNPQYLGVLWSTLSSAGATGATGPQGITGATGLAGPQGVAGLTGAQGPVGATGTAGISHLYTGSLNANTNCSLLGCYCPADICTTPSLAVPAGAYIVQADVNLYNFAVAGVNFSCSIVDGATGTSVGGSAVFSAAVGGSSKQSFMGWSSTATSYAVNCSAPGVLYGMSATVAAMAVGGIN
jgi:hypothetical protein